MMAVPIHLMTVDEFRKLPEDQGPVYHEFRGAKEFWAVGPDRRQVKVTTPDGHTRTWRSGQEIPLPLWGDAKVAVDAIFA